MASETKEGQQRKSLDLGCGPHRKLPGSIGLDKRPAPHADVVHGLNIQNMRGELVSQHIPSSMGKIFFIHFPRNLH